MSAVTARIREGTIQGREVDGVQEFLGIPYAAPPVEDLRFRPPQPHPGWAGVRECLEFGPIAPQGTDVAGFVDAQAPRDEDCLTLNVWTPALDDAQRPVMVWIHGGGFRQGASRSPLYYGDALARRGDVVVVTINYRLGVLGFLAHPDLEDAATGAAGNWGLLDQIAALEWVRENITALGGDPGNVTIFGESAGGGSVAALLASPKARGLFHRAIVQSGGPVAVSMKRAATLADTIRERAKVSGVRDLRTVSAADIFKIQTKLELESRGAMLLLPTVDGAVLDKYPADTLAAGAGAHVPTIIGTNIDEWKLFAAADPKAMQLTDEHLAKRLAKRLPGQDVEHIISVYRSSLEQRGEKTTPGEVWFAVESDRFFRVRAVEMAENLSRHHPHVWMYLFTWKSPAMRGWLGACHGLEIGFVFGAINNSELVAKFCGSGPDAEALQDKMMDAWLAFARTGAPHTDALGHWPPYTAATRETLVIGADHAYEHAPYDTERVTLDAAMPAGVSWTA